MNEDLERLLEKLGIDIGEELPEIDISIFCSKVGGEVLTDSKQCDIIKM